MAHQTTADTTEQTYNEVTRDGHTFLEASGPFLTETVCLDCCRPVSGAHDCRRLDGVELSARYKDSRGVLRPVKFGFAGRRDRMWEIAEVYLCAARSSRNVCESRFVVADIGGALVVLAEYAREETVR